MTVQKSSDIDGLLITCHLQKALLCKQEECVILRNTSFFHEMLNATGYTQIYPLFKFMKKQRHRSIGGN